MIPNIKKILVIRSDAIGDMVLTLPAIKAIKTKYPHAHLTVLASKANAPLLENADFIDEVLIKFPLKGLKRVWAYYKLFKEKKFNLIIHYWIRPYIAWPAFFTTKHNVGDKAHLALWPIFRKLGIFYNNHNRPNHVVHYNFEILKNLGIQITPETKLTLPITDNIKQTGKERLKTSGLSLKHPIVGIHVGVGYGNKAIEPEKYADYINESLKKQPLEFVLTGYTQKEKDAVQKILDRCPNNVTYVETKSVTDLLGVIANYSAYTSVDTGPFHIAAALGIPMLAIFPTKKVKPMSWGPFRNRHLVIRNNRNCLYDCPHQGCPHTICSDDISATQMATQLSELLNGAGVSTQTDQELYWFKKSLHLLILYNDKTQEEATELQQKLVMTGFYALSAHINDPKLFELIRQNDIAIIQNLTSQRKLRLFLMSQRANKFLHHPPLICHGPLTFNHEIGLINHFKELFNKR